MNPINSHSRAAVYSDCCTTSNVSVATWASHPVEPPTIRRFDVSALNAKKFSYSVRDDDSHSSGETFEYGRPHGTH